MLDNQNTPFNQTSTRQHRTDIHAFDEYNTYASWGLRVAAGSAARVHESKEGSSGMGPSCHNHPAMKAWMADSLVIGGSKVKVRYIRFFLRVLLRSQIFGPLRQYFLTHPT